MIVLAECGHSSNNRVDDIQEMWEKGAKWGWFMTWYDYDYNSGISTTHRHTDAEWWQAAWDSGITVDRVEMKQLLVDIKDGVRPPTLAPKVDGSQGWESAWYDLSGRRVSTPVKGVYLHKGKKILIK